MTVNREAASDLGLSVGTIGSALRPFLAGDDITSWQAPDGENYDVTVQLPREALVNWDLERRTAEVFVVSGEKADRRSVQTGLSGPGGVEVVSGVTPGDLVVVRGGFALKPGDRVAVSKAAGA